MIYVYGYTEMLDRNRYDTSSITVFGLFSSLNEARVACAGSKYDLLYMVIEEGVFLGDEDSTYIPEWLYLPEPTRVRKD